ncbi:hypothetical protein [Thioflexithrix psekupsensis]|uniref:hypothetical protein n=1 Tax=Thioflexithrix psekupsensis TaxID=1570016 RepID=UPI00111DD6B0|nr:hypothetical protein [Thioflexithrix psekupsensis]
MDLFLLMREITMTNPLPMYRKIFNQAKYYSEAAELLYKTGSNEGNASYIPGYILCSSFCIELLLKCLILIRNDDIFTKDDVKAKGIKIDDHVYSELFDKIDQTFQDRIVQTYNDLFNETITKDQYINLLSLGNKHFIEWRYIYEHNDEKNVDIEIQVKITNSLGKCIEDILKEHGL